MKYKFEIVDQHYNHRSYHYTFEAAEKQRLRNLSYCCGICGAVWKGWYQCQHGRHNQVCSGYYYNDKIIEIGE